MKLGTVEGGKKLGAEGGGKNDREDEQEEKRKACRQPRVVACC